MGFTFRELLDFFTFQEMFEFLADCFFGGLWPWGTVTGLLFIIG